MKLFSAPFCKHKMDALFDLTNELAARHRCQEGEDESPILATDGEFRLPAAIEAEFGEVDLVECGCQSGSPIDAVAGTTALFDNRKELPMSDLAEPKRATLAMSFKHKTARGTEQLVVAEACEQKNYGHWYCVTHDEHFRHNLAKDIHIGGKKYKCTLAWWCHSHGPEVP